MNVDIFRKKAGTKSYNVLFKEALFLFQAIKCIDFFGGKWKPDIPNMSAFITQLDLSRYHQLKNSNNLIPGVQFSGIFELWALKYPTTKC